MPIYRDRAHACFVFEFDRIIGGARRRVTRRLPKTWSRAEADAYDRQESGRFYALATGVERHRATIEQAVELYLIDKRDQKTIHARTQELALTYWAFRGKYIEDMPEVARAIRKEWEGKLAPASIRNRIAYLRAACRWGWKAHNLCEHDPGGRVQMPKVRNEKSNFLDRGEAIRVARAIRNRDARAAVLIGFYSGMRVGEVLRARPEGGVWTVTDTKNGTDAHVPIMPKVAMYARRWPRKLAKTTVQKWARIGMDAIGRPDASYHTLRHSTATAILDAGASLDMVGDVLRHRDKRSTQRYAHRKLEAIAGAMGSLGRKSPDAKVNKKAGNGA